MVESGQVIKNPHATAIYVKDSTIVFVGSDAEAVSRAQDGASKIDLEGKFVTPGFIDNHVHFISGGLHLSRIDLSGATRKMNFNIRLPKIMRKFQMVSGCREVTGIMKSGVVCCLI